MTAELIIFGVSLFIEVPKGSTEALEILLIQVNPVLVKTSSLRGVSFSSFFHCKGLALEHFSVKRLDEARTALSASLLLQ